MIVPTRGCLIPVQWESSTVLQYSPKTAIQPHPNETESPRGVSRDALGEGNQPISESGLRFQVHYLSSPA